MTNQHPSRRTGTACARVGVGSMFAYDGGIVTIVGILPTLGGYEVLVQALNGDRRYSVALSEFLGSGCAATGQGQS